MLIIEVMEEEIVRMYQNGYSMQGIAKELGIGYTKTRNVIIRAGIVRSRGEATTVAYKKGRRVPFCDPNRKGDMNPAWKGGRHTMKGYLKVWVPEHPYCDSKGYVFEHRLVVEKYIGRYLRTDEIVHHKDGVRSHNDIDNLQITNSKEHGSITRQEHRLRLWKNSATYALIRDYKQELREMRKKGMSHQEITDVLGVPLGAVKYAIRKNLDLSPSWIPIVHGPDKCDPDNLRQEFFQPQLFDELPTRPQDSDQENR